MPARGYPIFADQPSPWLYCFKIDGSEVTATSSSAGLDGRGQAIADIADAGAVQTIVWKQAFPDTPYVWVQPLTDNGAANISVTTTGMVLTGVERDDNTAALADQDFLVFVMGFQTTTYIL